MTEKQIWDKILSLTDSEIFTAAIMGNMKAESALKGNNMQNSYEKKLGYTDETYTMAINQHAYCSDKFSNDKAGYGLCQWTHPSRKKSLYEFWLNYDPACSIGDESMQIEFCIFELQHNYPGIWSNRKSYLTVEAATTDLLRKYERPADQSDENVKRRAAMGQSFYTAYANDYPGSSGEFEIPLISKHDLINDLKEVETILDDANKLNNKALEKIQSIMEELE